MKSDQIIEKIKAKLQESDPVKRTVMSIFQFNFTDADGQLIKSVVFDFKDLKIYEGKASEKPDGEITVSDDDFYLVGTKAVTFDELMAQEKVQIEGDTDAITKVMEKFRLNAQK